MNIDNLILNLKDWDKSDPDYTSYDQTFIDKVNTENKQIRGLLRNKLGGGQGKSHAKLYGGAVDIEFIDVSNDAELDDVLRGQEPEFIMEQLGGGPLSAIGDMYDRVYMRLLPKSYFKKFYANYEGVRTKLEEKINSFKLEADTLKKMADAKSQKLREMFVNGKAGVITGVMGDDMELSDARRTSLKNEAVSINNTEKIYDKEIKEYDRAIKKKNKKYYTIFGFDIPAVIPFFKDSIIKKMEVEVQNSFTTFHNLTHKYELVARRLAELRELKSKYGGVTDADVSKLMDEHKSEYKKYLKNKSLIDDLDKINMSTLQEINELVQAKDKFFLDIQDFKDTFGGLDKQATSAGDALKTWKNMSRETYIDINSAVKMGSKYLALLSTIETLTEDNHNYISAIAVGALKPVRDKYAEHKQSVGYTKDTMAKLVATLKEVKNRYIKLEPSINMRADLFSISYAKTSILNMVQNIYNRQLVFSQGDKYIKQIIRQKQTGGSKMRLTGGSKMRLTGGNIDFGIDKVNFPVYFKHYGDVIFNRGPQKHIAVGTAVTIELEEIPYGALVLHEEDHADFNTGRPLSASIPPAIKVKAKYDSYFTHLNTAGRINYIPIYNYKQHSITVYKIKYNNIADIGKLDISTTEVIQIPNTTVDTNTKQFIQIPGTTNYYIYNLYAKDATLDGIVDGFLEANNISPEFAILPLFYNIYHRAGSFINYDEYQMINPITGIPILSAINTNPATRELELTLYGIDNTNKLDPGTPIKNNAYYYHYNPISITYDIKPGDRIQHIYTNGGPVEAFRNSNYNIRTGRYKDDCIGLHHDLMLQLTLYMNKIVGDILYFSTANIVDNTRINGLSTNVVNSIESQFTARGTTKTAIRMHDKTLDTILINMFGADTVPKRIASILITKHIFNNTLRDGSGASYISISRATGPGGAPATGPGGPMTSPAGRISLGMPAKSEDRLDPVTRQNIDIVMRSLPPTHVYWKNLDTIIKSITPFFSAEYRTEFEDLLGTMVSNTIEMARVEEKVLKFSANTPPITMPKYTLVTKDMEIKAEKGDVPITDAGKNLTDFLKTNKDYIKKFENDVGVNSATLLTGPLSDLLIKLASKGKGIDVASWFRTGDPQLLAQKESIKAYLASHIGASEFINLIDKSSYKSSSPTIFSYIASNILAPTNDVYNVYKPHFGNTTIGVQTKKSKKSNTRGKALAALLGVPTKKKSTK